LTFGSPLDCPLGLPFFLTGPIYVSALKSLSDSVTGVEDTRGGFFGLFFAFARFCIETIVARVSELGFSLVRLAREDVYSLKVSYTPLDR
jgi:hypothetical protein